METINQNNKLTEKEIKFLKRTLWRQIFPSLTITLFLFLIIFVYSSLNNNFGLVFISLTFSSVIIGTIVFLIITRKYKLDLKTGQVKQENEIVEDKIYKLDYEPGSRTFPVNLLSILFIKKISQTEMIEMHIFYIMVKGERIDLDKDDFQKAEKGQPIIIRRTPISNTFLGVQTI
ncbi:MAG TPA: hypothetical protein PKW80_11825 [Bacteroidales bacterium]|nr:hypothetical protein [Bacteroidales bacterium]